jgi:hypothetical protein
MDKKELNSSWTLWFHRYDDNKWDLESYTKLNTFNTIEEFSILLHLIKEKHIQNGMFFLMREEILPMWESEDNKDGGCFSLKIFKQDIQDAWKTLTTKLVNESLLKDTDKYNLVNGISISPKKTYSIIKLWFKGEEINKLEQLNNNKVLENSTPIYKKHQ